MTGLLSLVLSIYGCLPPKKTTTSALQKCNPTLKTNLATKSNVRFQLALIGAPPACSSIQNYSCSRRLFSPDATDSKYNTSECVTSGVLSGSCFDVSTFSFSTKSATSMPSMDPKEFEPGGSLNYQEYSCYNSETKVSGQGAHLNEALNLAYDKCNGTVP